MLKSTHATPFDRLPFARVLFDPVWCAFAGSLLLSAIAIYGTELPNRDGMLYIETASIFLKDGLAAARANFDWVFFPVCIAFVSKATGLGLEAAAYLLNTVLFAGVCATLVRTVQVRFPSAAWCACLVVLAFPSFNAQRNEIIREAGAWFFCLQSLLAALRWQRNPGYRRGFLVQGALAIACLFRVESAVFFIALALWPLFFPVSWRQRLEQVLMLVSLPFVAGVALLAGVALGYVDVGGRLGMYASAANPVVALARFRSVAGQFGATILNRYSADEAGSILFFGLVGMVVKKFIAHNGILLVPFAVFLGNPQLRRQVRAWQPEAQFFVVYAVVLIAFVVNQLFISGRYVILLNILTMPLIALGLARMFASWPRWRAVFLVCLTLAALANVVSLSPPKTQYREAGQWLSARPEIAAVTYIEDSRICYFSGGAFSRAQKMRWRQSKSGTPCARGRSITW